MIFLYTILKPYLEDLLIANCRKLYFALFYVIYTYFRSAQNVRAVTKTYFAAYKHLKLYFVSLFQCPTVLVMNAKTVVELVELV